MTIEITEPDWTDRLLRRMGKRRAILIPDGEARFGPFVYARARKEPFLSALLRPRNAPPPAGWIYPSFNTCADRKN